MLNTGPDKLVTNIGPILLDQTHGPVMLDQTSWPRHMVLSSHLSSELHPCVAPLHALLGQPPLHLRGGQALLDHVIGP